MSCYEALAGSYDALTEDVGYGKRLDFIEKLLCRSRIPVKLVLDLACGTGTMSWLLTQQGYEVIGVDGSEDMLAAAMSKTGSVQDVQRTFRRLHLFVAPGGMLVFDVNTAAKLAALDGQVFLDETEDTYCVWRTEYHRGLCTYYMDLFRRRGDGAWRRSAEVHRQRAYSVEELTAWLAAAGFGDVRVYGDMRMRRPRADEQRVYISCVRK